MRIRYPRCLKMLVGRWVLATGRHISRSRRTTSTYFENGSRTHTQKLTANYHLPRNVCIRLTWASALAAQCTLACSTLHYPCVYSWRHLAAVRCSRAGAVDQSKPGAFVHPQHCPVVWSVPPSLLTCHAHIYPAPIFGVLPRPCITLVMIFFSCD